MSPKIRYGEFKPENSDGCSVIGSVYRFFSSEDSLPFKQCCVEHDRAYYYGGPVHLRDEADLKLYQCVKSHGFPFIAWIMWVFVRMFAGTHILKFFPNPFYWAWSENVVVLPENNKNNET